VVVDGGVILKCIVKVQRIGAGDCCDLELEQMGGFGKRCEKFTGSIKFGNFLSTE